VSVTRVGREVEVKLALPSAFDGRRLLRKAGFGRLHRRLFESNTLYDTPRRRLGARGSLLRLRSFAGRMLLTYKGPPEPGRHKSREELEITISDGLILETILEQLGLIPSFYYEKYRTTFRRPGSSGLALLDETPIGVFLELEGPPRWIDRTAREFGFDSSAYITASYGRLFLEYCRRRGLRTNRMAFPERRAGNSPSTPGKLPSTLEILASTN